VRARLSISTAGKTYRPAATSPLTQVNLSEPAAGAGAEKPKAAPHGEAASAKGCRHHENPMAPASIWTL
jgi:hypothetical protein